MAAYSNSLLGTYEQCPLKYKLRYRDRIKRELETVERLLGTIVHVTLKKCYDDYRFGRGKDLDGLLDHFNNLWKNRWNDSIIIMKQNKTQEYYQSHGEEMIGNYYRHYSPFSSDLTIDTELPVSFFLDDTHKYRMIGYIDRLSRTPDGIVQIHDYKTSANLPRQAEVDTERQLALYQIGVQQKWPDFKDIRLIWHYLSFDTELVSSRSPKAISELAWNTMRLIDEIESTQDYPPKESGLCDWCEYPDLCPLRKQFVKMGSFTKAEFVNEPGITLVETYVFLKNRAESTDVEIEKAKVALLEYARREGMEVIRGSEHQVRIKHVSKFKFPDKSDIERKELENIIYEVDKWARVFQTDIASLTSIIDSKLRNNELMEQIVKYKENEMGDTIQISQLMD